MRTKTSGAKAMFGNRSGRTPGLSASQILAMQEALRLPGVTREQVGKRYGICGQTVRKYFDKFGVPTETARKVLANRVKPTQVVGWNLDDEIDEVIG